LYPACNARQFLQALPLVAVSPGRWARSRSARAQLRSIEEVDALLAHAAAGGTFVKPGHHTDWGGFAGYFADPDGFLLEVAWNPKFPPV
jgi:uncharacterized glyoxalase superfamily protein PhnB